MAATLDNTLGVTFLSVVGASILSGTTLAQTYVYYHNYRQDPILNKCAVGILCLLDALHLAFFVHAVYIYSVTEYGNIPALKIIFWSVKVQALINIVVILSVHSLYAHRVWMLSGYYKGKLGYLVAFAVAAGAAVGFLLIFVIFRLHTFPELEELAWAVNTALGTATSIDFVISAAMCYYLRKSRCNISTNLNSKISKVIQYTISSGLLTSSWSLAALASYNILPQTNIGISLAAFGTKLYTASFFAMLNSREQGIQRASGTFNSLPNISLRRSLRTVTDLKTPISEEARNSPHSWRQLEGSHE